MGKVAMLFPGQGIEYIGMSKSLTGLGRELCDEYTVARETFDEVSEALSVNLTRICTEGSLEEVKKPENYQPCMLAASISAFRVYMLKTGRQPDYVAGHSSGEVTAMVCAEAISLSDAARIVRWSGAKFQSIFPKDYGKMALVSLIPEEELRLACEQLSSVHKCVAVANYNSKDQIVVSGHSEAVEELGLWVKKRKGIFIPLKVGTPFHSPLMEVAKMEFQQELKKVTFHDTRYPVIANATALPYKSKETMLDNLILQMVTPVQWRATMELLEENGVDITIEMGPPTGLKNLSVRNAPTIKAYTFDTDLEMITQELGQFSSPNKSIEINGEEQMPLKEIEKKLGHASAAIEALQENSIKKRVYSVWRDILGTADIDISKSFTENGCQSMQLVMLYSRLEEEFPGVIDVSDLYMYPSVLELSKNIENQLSQKASDSSNTLDIEDDEESLLYKVFEGVISVDEAVALIDLEEDAGWKI